MSLSRRWKLFLTLATIAGILLRVLHTDDMEYKEDEEFNFVHSQDTFFAWLGMPSGVYIPNPGGSIWCFQILARLTGAHSPISLEHSLQALALLGIALIIPFAVRFVHTPDEREPWLWAFALAMVNPFQILYQRKLWPEPFFPFFSMIFLACWWRRDRFWPAFFWGWVGAVLGQIHMSGFFFAAAFLIASLAIPHSQIAVRKIKWKAWFFGSVLGAMPLLPWFYEILAHPVHEKFVRGWSEILQLKFWVFWFSNPIGFHLGNPLGLLRGQSTWAQLSDFLRYPLILDHASWINAAAHLVQLVIAAALAVAVFRRGLGIRKWIGPFSNTFIALVAAGIGFGILLTATGITIRRYYMMVGFPLEFVWLAVCLLGAYGTPRARTWLGALWVSQVIVSACFVLYIHTNQGSTQGDYGDAYHLVLKKKAALDQH